MEGGWLMIVATSCGDVTLWSIRLHGNLTKVIADVSDVLHIFGCLKRQRISLS